MADLSLSKQVGPLPLGAWIVVVGAGLGIAYYTRRQNSAPIEVESGNAESGVGVGGSGMYTELTPVVTAPGTTKPTTNEAWGVEAIQWLVNNNYPLSTADSAIRKFLAGAGLSAHEYTLVGLVVVAKGYPPQMLPPAPGGDDPDPPPTGGGIPESITVNEGTHVDPWISSVNASYPGLNLTKIKLKVLNPGIRIAQANKFGYISSSNPANRAGGGPVIDVFNVGSSKAIKVR